VRLEEELDGLYALPLDEFTAARDELAKRLRAEGERDRADEVKALRKPTVAVWLVNQLARDREIDVKRLLKAGEALGKAQASARGFSEARRSEQEALGRLASAARESGVGPQAAERAIQTLRAASLTDEGRDLLKRGRLTEELQPPGFEALAGLPAPKKPRAKPKPKPRKNPQLKKAQERVKKLKAEAERAQREAAAAAERLAKAEAELEQLS
jgi:predicted GNAT family N-acyltransferase